MQFSFLFPRFCNKFFNESFKCISENQLKLIMLFFKNDYCMFVHIYKIYQKYFYVFRIKNILETYCELSLKVYILLYTSFLFFFFKVISFVLKQKCVFLTHLILKLGKIMHRKHNMCVNFIVTVLYYGCR